MPNRRTRLDNLLKIAIEAHGGLNAWNQFESLRASVSIGGAFWDQKELPGLFNNGRTDLKLRRQQMAPLTRTRAEKGARGKGRGSTCPRLSPQ
jgi:hypothetical protein